MPLSCDWPTKVITIPASELTLVSGTYYTLDVTYYFQLLRELNGGAEGISQTIGAPLYNNTPPTTGTPRIVDIINGYTIQFEDLLISVDFINGNTNWREVEIRNNVSVGTNNTAALIDPEALQAATYNGFLGISVNPDTGADFGKPIPGNSEYPVKTEEAMHVLLAQKGFKRVFVESSFSLFKDHSVGHTFIGANPQTVVMTIGDKLTYPLKSVANCIFHSFYITGELDTNNQIRECIVGPITNANGFIYTSTIIGPVVLSNNVSIQGNWAAPTANNFNGDVDYDEKTVSCIISGYQGGLVTVYRMVTGSKFFYAGTGKILFDASCTGGDVELYGDVKVINNGGVFDSFNNETINSKIDDIHTRLSLEKGNPWTDTPTQSRDNIGKVIINNTGDGELISTGSRQ